MTEYSLGRLHSPDVRDRNFPLRAAVRTVEDRAYRYWGKGPWQGDQGSTSQCVAYSSIHWLHAGPVVHRKPTPFLNPEELYKKAQSLDEWPGDDYNGTSVRGAAKALKEQGLIQDYHWGFDLNSVVDAVISTGPVVMGTNWYESMFEPKNGVVKVEGGSAGGHAYLLYGVNKKTKTATFRNSWGKDYGNNGCFRMSFTDLERLILEDGEAMLATETP